MYVVFTLLSYAGPAMVGGVFLLTGLLKALDPHRFGEHLRQLGLFPRALLSASVASLIALEWVLGAALVLRLYPEWLFPAGIFLLLGLSAVTLWSSAAGRTEDCGCYQGLLNLSPWRSVLLNLVYAALLGIAWAFPAGEAAAPAWKLVIVPAAGLLGAALTGLAHRYALKRGTPLLDFRPLKIGTTWRAEWFGGDDHHLSEGRKLIVFLNPECSVCEQWLRLLAIIQGRRGLPDFVGAVSLPPEESESYGRKHGVTFPVVSLSRGRMNRLVPGAPWAVLLEEGMIRRVFRGGSAKALLDRLKAYQAQSSQAHAGMEMRPAMPRRNRQDKVSSVNERR